MTPPKNQNQKHFHIDGSCSHELSMLESLENASSLQEQKSILDEYLRNNQPCIRIPSSGGTREECDDWSRACSGDINNDGVLSVSDLTY